MGVCIGGMWLIAWAKWIAIAILVVVTCSVLFVLWKMRKSVDETAITAEQFKLMPPEKREEMSEWAKQFQNPFTQAVVKDVRERAKKVAKVADAFKTSGGVR